MSFWTRKLLSEVVMFKTCDEEDRVRWLEDQEWLASQGKKLSPKCKAELDAFISAREEEKIWALI